jgi:hypothetical protein
MSLAGARCVTVNVVAEKKVIFHRPLPGEHDMLTDRECWCKPIVLREGEARDDFDLMIALLTPPAATVRENVP